jgi:hypothetical protein
MTNFFGYANSSCCIYSYHDCSEAGGEGNRPDTLLRLWRRKMIGVDGTTAE